jgi:hypothetical protein
MRVAPRGKIKVHAYTFNDGNVAGSLDGVVSMLASQADLGQDLCRGLFGSTLSTPLLPLKSPRTHAACVPKLGI